MRSFRPRSVNVFARKAQKAFRIHRSLVFHRGSHPKSAADFAANHISTDARCQPKTSPGLLS